jgi:hypothetical protein
MACVLAPMPRGAELHGRFALGEESMASMNPPRAFAHEPMDLSVGDLANAILENQPGSCWGGQLTGSDWRCDSSFEVSGPHFKHKFCASCQASGIHVSASRVRMLAPGSKSKLVNGKGGGVWTKLSSRAVVGDKRDRKQLQNETVFFRMVNHTARCDSPRIVIFEGRPIEQEWIPIPPAWISQLDQTVHLIIRKGTLVPAAAEHPHTPGLLHHMPQPVSLLSSPVLLPHPPPPLLHVAASLARSSPHLLPSCGAGSLDHLRRLDKMVRGKAGSSSFTHQPPMPPLAPATSHSIYPSPPPMHVSPPFMLAPSAGVGCVASGWTSRAAPAFVSQQPDSVSARWSTPAFQRATGATAPASFEPIFLQAPAVASVPATFQFQPSTAPPMPASFDPMSFQPPAAPPTPASFESLLPPSTDAAIASSYKPMFQAPPSIPASFPGPLDLSGLAKLDLDALQHTLQAELALSRARAAQAAGNGAALPAPLPWENPLANLVDEASEVNPELTTQSADAFLFLLLTDCPPLSLVALELPPHG